MICYEQQQGLLLVLSEHCSPKEVDIKDGCFLVAGVSVSNKVDPRLPRQCLDLYKERSGLLLHSSHGEQQFLVARLLRVGPTVCPPSTPGLLMF